MPARRSALTCGFASLKTFGASEASQRPSAAATSGRPRRLGRGIRRREADAARAARPRSMTVTPTSPCGARRATRRALPERARSATGAATAAAARSTAAICCSMPASSATRGMRVLNSRRAKMSRTAWASIGCTSRSSRADRQLDVAQQPVERAVAADVVEVLAQVAADHAGDLVGVLEQRVEGAELAEPLDRGLLADLRHAGQVVARLADERGDVGVLLGRHAVALDHGVAVVALELRDALHVRVEQRDVVVDELDRVAVARAHEHVEPLLGALRGEGREDVVGLDVLLLEDRDAHRREAVLQERDLALELARASRSDWPCTRCTRACGRTAGRCRRRPPCGSASRP